MCPLDPDTQRLGSFPDQFQLLCPGTRQQIHLPQYQYGLTAFLNPRPHKECGYRDDSWLWETFANPVTVATPVQYFRSKFTAQEQPNRLERLPAELIANVVDKVLADDDDCTDNAVIESVLALAISSPILYPIVLASITLSINHKKPESWAGKEVGFFGVYSRFTTKQLLAHGLQDDFHSTDTRVGFRCWNKVESQPERRWIQALQDLSRRWDRLAEADVDSIERDLAREWRYPRDQVWVLRNMTTRQIVRSDTLEQGPCTKSWSKAPKSNLANMRDFWAGVRGVFSRQHEGAGMFDSAPMTLAQAFLLMTVYSNAGMVSRDERVFLFQDGPWNGHAFDLVTLHDHEEEVKKGISGLEMNSKSWKDVTSIVAFDIYHLRWCVRQSDQLRRSTGSLEKEKDFWRAVHADRLIHRSWNEERELESANAHFPEGSSGGRFIRAE